MFTDDSLATAEIAKIFGSELLHVQSQARTDAGTQPEILKMHPTQFLGSSPQQQQMNKQRESEIMRKLQREAEAACPLPEQFSPPPAQQSAPLLPITQPAIQQPSLQQPLPLNPLALDSSELKKLNHNLDRIATILEKSIELFAKMSTNE